MVSMLATLLARQARASSGKASGRLFERAVHHAETHLHAPELNAQTIAAAIGVSLSALHDSARRHGTTIGQMIQERRLQRCRDALRDKRLERRQISDIAFAWGFNDAAHFSRSFRTRFGVTPRAWRRGAD